ncbi:MAG: HPF/RaiA family ribosome-associated protein [Saprospiraceae bacterium]|nr:HPF/RaiA family ribosome-associated protein [Saprospiraceae bacterium]
MELIYQTIHFHGSEHLELFTRKKMSSIFKMDSNIMKAEVTLSEGANGNRQNQFCEINLDVPGENIFVKKNAATYEQAIRMAVTAAQKIIRRRKD